MEKNKKSKKKLIIILSIMGIIVIGAIITLLIIMNGSHDDDDEIPKNTFNTTEKKDNEKSEDKMMSDIKYYLETSEINNFTSEENDDGKYTINFDYNKGNIYLHVCAADSQYYMKKIMDKNIENKEKISTFNMYCKQDGEVKYIITINNFEELTENNLEQNTIIKDENGTSLNKTVSQTTQDYINDYKNSCKTYDYKTIFRYAEEYKGKDVKYTGKVVQVIEGSSYTSYRVNITKDRWGYYDDTVYVIFMDLDKKTPRILEDDIITFYGTLGDLYTYETVMGSSVTIPSVTAYYITLILF